MTRDISWGVPVPLAGYENKVIYVWFDAVIGYLSATKEWAAHQGQPDGWREWWEDKDVKSYYVTGQDAEKASVQYIIDGKQGMTVFKDVRTLVSDAIAAAVAYLKGATPDKSTTYNNGKIDVPSKPSAIVTVTKANVKAALVDSGYYQASDFTGL